jgi:glycosyltransferase involved in cell wall biosynthesis
MESTMMLPKLSVIIPNYNHGQYLQGCLNAVLVQSQPAHEIIIIDDGSTDNSVQIIEELARHHPTLKFFRNEVNRGVIFTINRGIDLSTGDYVCTLAADDQVQQGLFEKSLKILARYPHAGLSGTICRFINETSGLRYHLGGNISDKPRYFSPTELVALGRQNRLIIFTSTMILRRDVLLAANKYLPDLRWHADWFVLMAIAARHGLCFIPEVLGEFRVLHGSYSQKGMSQRDAQVQVLRRLLERLDEVEYQDVTPFVRNGTLLASFGKEMLYVLTSKRRYWHYLTSGYLRWAIWWIIRIEAKKRLPKSLARLYFAAGGYNKLPTQNK